MTNARKLTIAVWMVLSIGVFGSAYALDPQKRITQYGHDIWRRQNGLPSDVVNAVVQTRDGYLWFGTPAGLYRFDGVSCTPILVRQGAAVDLDNVKVLCEGRDSSLWIGTAFNGLRRFKHGVITSFGPEDSFYGRRVSAILESRLGNIWVATSDGLYLFRDGKCTAIQTDRWFISCLAENAEGNILVGSREGVRLYDDATGSFVRTILSDSDRDRIVVSMLVDRKGRIWIGLHEGLFCIQSGITTVYHRSDGLADDHVLSLCEDRSGGIWAGTFNGLSRFEGRRWDTYTQRDGLSHNQILCLQADREGSLWIGTVEGLNRFRDVDLTTFTTKEGLFGDLMAGVTELPDGTLMFFCNQNNSVSILKDGKFTRDSLSVGPEFASSDGSVWVGQNGHLTHYRAGRKVRYDQRNSELPARWISAIAEDDESLIIYIDHLGVRRFVDGKLYPYLLRDGQPFSSTQFVYQFYLDPDSALWMATTNGLVAIRHGVPTRYDSSSGLSDNWFYSITDDRQGNLWFSSANGGIMRLRDGKFTAFTTKNGLFSNEIYGVQVDNLGDIWMASPRGIGRLTHSELAEYEAGRSSQMHCRVYTTTDGLKSDACFEYWQPSTIKASDGRLWFCTRQGVVLVDPGKMTMNTQPPPVELESVVADDKKLDPAPELTCTPGTEKLEFHYGALSFLVPERVLFKYKLEGYDLRWVDAGTRRVAYYTNLPPGEYTFTVIACNNDGVWNETGAKIRVYLKPRFYQTAWFVAMAILLGAGVIYGGFRMRVRSLRNREHQLEGLVRERTHELERQQTLLQDQRSFLHKIIDLNPSFIFAKTREGRFTLANRALAQAYGATPEELLGKTDADFINDERETEAIRAYDQDVIETQKERTTPEEEFVGKDGVPRWLQTTRIPIIPEDGQDVQVLGVSNDVTLQKQAALEMQHAKEAAEAATRSKSEFLANMSHEIRTPMNAIIGMTGLLLDTSLDTEQREYVEIVRTSSDSLLTIINDILDFSKIESGKLELEHNAFHLAGCIEESLDLLASKAVEKGIELAYMLDESTPHGIAGDITRLRQILVNLLSNAVKFTHRGEVVVTVVSRPLGGTQHELHFAVRDTGIGIPKDRRDRLFKSFSQVDSSTTRQYGGTGLGLAISKRLSELMGGRMWVESEEGKGSTFHFTIIATSVPTIEKLQPGNEGPVLQGKKLLIVDDNDTNRRILTAQSQAWGMQPTALGLAREALGLIEKGEHFDLAILDLNMPEMDGATLAQKLKDTLGPAVFPIILLTSLSTGSRQLREQCGNLQVAAFLSKPLKHSQLFDVMVTALLKESKPAAPATDSAKMDPDLAKRLPLRILLAEDNMVNQKVALRVLERFGYRADVAANGKEAVDAVRRQQYDLIFMDVQMPQMDGLEATRRICAEWPEERPRIIAMTANASQADRDECITAGMDGYVSKPVRIEELRSILEKIGQNVQGHKPTNGTQHPADDPTT